jgi:hypothetical protein
VINETVWGGALLYYFAFAHTWFKGPVHNTHNAEEEEEENWVLTIFVPCVITIVSYRQTMLLKANYDIMRQII